MAEAENVPLDANDVALSFAEVTAPGATPDGEPRQPAEQPPPSPPPAPPGQPPRQSQLQPAAIEPPDAMIPSARLREEAEARRNAERRAETLQAQVEAMFQRFAPVQPQQAPQRQRADVFENPSTFVQEEVGPLIEAQDRKLMEVIERFSRRDAYREFGPQLVNEAFGVIEQGIRTRDPEIHQTYNRIMATPDPYGEMVRWYQQRKLFADIGGDLNAYNQRVLQAAMQNPDFQAQVIAAARGQAPQVAQPAQPRTSNGQFASSNSQPSLPSITRVGSTGLHPSEQTDETDDHELFVQTTTGRRQAPK